MNAHTYTCIYIYTHMYHIYVCTYVYRYIILYTYICVNINYSNCYGKEWNTPKFLPVELGDLSHFWLHHTLIKFSRYSLASFLSGERSERWHTLVGWWNGSIHKKRVWKTMDNPILTRNGLFFLTMRRWWFMTLCSPHCINFPSITIDQLTREVPKYTFTIYNII